MPLLQKLAYFKGYTPLIKFPNRHQSSKYSGKKITLTNRQALNQALSEELARDPSVYLIGEEVAQYQGAYKISKGLFEKFGGSRVVDTPITEAGFTGIAIGSSLMGLKPVV